MGELESGFGQMARIGFWAAAATLMSAAALAQDLYYINVNPILVCPGGDCTGVMASAPGSSQIGFTDPATQMDITRAILGQAGIDVHWGSLQTLPSPGDPGQAPNTLQLSPGMVTGQVSSSDFQSLSFQNQIANGVTPIPSPLSPDPHTINLFFTTNLNPNGALAGSTYFGLGWIGNNGAVVSQAIFGSQSPLFGTVGAVPDALAHELVHDLGLEHGTANTPQDPTNLMSAVRNEPTINDTLSALGAGGGMGAGQLNTGQVTQIINPSGGPLNSFLNPIPGVTTTVSSSDPILVARCVEFTPCYTTGPTPWTDTLTAANLASLGLGTTQPFVAAQTSQFVIQLGATSIRFDTTTGPVTETLPEFTGSFHSDPCNFCEIDTVGSFSIPANATDATISGAFGNSFATASAGANLCLGAGPPCAPSPNDFSASFQGAGRAGESLLMLTLTAPTGVLFDPFSFSQLNLPGDTAGITVSPSFSNCSEFTGVTEACSVLQLAFGGPSFVLGDKIDYTLGFCLETGAQCLAASDLNDLAGGRYTYEFNDGYGTNSLLELVNGELSASSQRPDFSTPTSLDLALFTPFSSSLPCVMVGGSATCPPLAGDGDTVEDLIFLQAPEPPSGAILIAGLGLWFVLAKRRRSRGSSSAAYSIPTLRRPSRK